MPAHVLSDPRRHLKHQQGFYSLWPKASLQHAHVHTLTQRIHTATQITTCKLYWQNEHTYIRGHTHTYTQGSILRVLQLQGNIFIENSPTLQVTDPLSLKKHTLPLHTCTRISVSQMKLPFKVTAQSTAVHLYTGTLHSFHIVFAWFHCNIIYCLGYICDFLSERVRLLSGEERSLGMWHRWCLCATHRLVMSHSIPIQLTP